MIHSDLDVVSTASVEEQSGMADYLAAEELRQQEQQQEADLWYNAQFWRSLFSWW